MNWFDKFDKARAVYEQSRKEKERLKAHRERLLRLEDLYVRFHQIDEDVRLPFPSFYALKWLDKRFNGFENIDLNNLQHLSALIWILEHQHDVDEIAGMNDAQVENAIDRHMSAIPAALYPRYLICADELLRAVKKNFLRSQREMLESLLETLGKN